MISLPDGPTFYLMGMGPRRFELQYPAVRITVGRKSLSSNPELGGWTKLPYGPIAVGEIEHII